MDKNNKVEMSKKERMFYLHYGALGLEEVFGHGVRLHRS